MAYAYAVSQGWLILSNDVLTFTTAGLGFRRQLTVVVGSFAMMSVGRSWKRWERSPRARPHRNADVTARYCRRDGLGIGSGSVANDDPAQVIETGGRLPDAHLGRCPRCRDGWSGTAPGLSGDGSGRLDESST